MIRAASELMSLGMLLSSPAIAEPESTEVSAGIALWYGAQQKFGQRGTPQRWVNILGSTGALADITRLSYRLNNGPEQALARGPDQRRLAAEGDFNVEIPALALSRAADAQNFRRTIGAIRVLTRADGSPVCGAKVWPRGARDPNQWLVYAGFRDVALATGSILFVADNTDLTLGQIAFRLPALAH